MGMVEVIASIDEGCLKEKEPRKSRRGSRS